MCIASFHTRSGTAKKNAVTSILVVTLAMIAAAALFSYLFHAYVLEKAEENITNLLLSHKGIHHYVQNSLIPAYSKYQELGKIPAAFYAPELLSSSFIVRNQHIFYNQERKAAGFPELYYKLAANNPRNPINKADSLEKNLIKMFNDHRDIKSYKKIVEIDGKKVLYVAIPFLENDARCMRCHSRREDAPPELQERYPGQGGFDEKLGEIRAITSIRAPMENEYMHIYTIGLTIFVGFIAFGGLFSFNTRLRALIRKKTASLKEEIAERKYAEEILSQNRSMLNQILNTTPQSIFWKDINGIYLGCNQVFAQAAGLAAPDRIVGKTDFDLPWPRQEADAYRADDREVIRFNRVKRHIIEPLQQADGTRIWVDTSKVPLLDEQGKVYGVLGVYEDITERKKAEEELKIKESAIAASINAIILADLDGNLTYVNKSFLSLWGHDTEEEVLGKPIIGFWQSGNEAQGLIRRLRETGRWLGEMQAENKNGEAFIVQVSSGMIHTEEGRPLCLMASFLDVTEKHRLEDQIRQSQRLEAMGTLAGGIAHDFNNILSPILGYADMVQEELPQGSEVWHNQQAVINAGYRAKDLVQQILAFSRQAEYERRPIQIHHIVKEALKLLRASIPTTIEIRQDIETASGVVHADPTQIHQVMMNLCTNAFHAMQKTGGILGVSLTAVEIEKGDDKVNGLDLTPGRYLRLEVSDTGCGMDKKILTRIFEPYFTTKEKGKGTGLGLAMVHGIVKSHGGHITVYSEPGKGTNVHVYLPQMLLETAAPGIAEKEALPVGSERVLIVDDEDIVVQMEGKMLESLGYEITALTDSLEAWELLSKQPNAFDLVITDMTMPKMTGVELARRYFSVRPGALVILCTGFSELVTEEKAKAVGISEFIMKPVVKKDLAKAVRKVLDKDKPQAV